MQRLNIKRQNYILKFKNVRDRAKYAALAMVLIFMAGGISEARYSGGTGEPNDPYRIGTAADLNDIGNHVEDYNKCFVMVADIEGDLRGTIRDAGIEAVGLISSNLGRLLGFVAEVYDERETIIEILSGNKQLDDFIGEHFFETIIEELDI